MRETMGRLRIGALVFGLGLALSVAAPAMAQETASALTPDGSQEAVADSTQSYVADVVDVDPQTAFTDAFVACTFAYDINTCTDAALEDAGLRPQTVIVTESTPLNPNDTTVFIEPAIPYDLTPPGL